MELLSGMRSSMLNAFLRGDKYILEIMTDLLRKFINIVIYRSPR